MCVLTCTHASQVVPLSLLITDWSACQLCHLQEGGLTALTLWQIQLGNNNFSLSDLDFFSFNRGFEMNRN